MRWYVVTLGDSEKWLSLCSKKMLIKGSTIVNRKTTSMILNSSCLVNVIDKCVKNSKIIMDSRGTNIGLKINDIILASLIIICPSILSLFITYFLNLATGIFSCCLYLATVLLATGNPLSFKITDSSSSVKGFFLFSLSIHS